MDPSTELFRRSKERISVLRGKKDAKISHPMGKLGVSEEPFPENNNLPPKRCPSSTRSVAFQERFPPNNGVSVRFMERLILPVGWIEASASPSQADVFSRGALKEAWISTDLSG